MDGWTKRNARRMDGQISTAQMDGKICTATRTGGQIDTAHSDVIATAWLACPPSVGIPRRQGQISAACMDK